jgi:branched-chain amino acid aminotransferase
MKRNLTDLYKPSLRVNGGAGHDGRVAKTVTEHRARSSGRQRPFEWVFVDGSFVQADEARVSVHAHVLSYGTGTFEGICASWNDQAQELYLLEPATHYERMHRSANALGLTLPYSTEELVARTIELLRRNEAHSDVYVRPLLLLSGEVLAVRMHEVATRFSIAVSPFRAGYLDRAEVRCLVSSWRRSPDSTLPLRAKIIGTYVGPALAKTEAVQAGVDEALMLTVDGSLAEATTSNVFLRRGSAWVTPGVDQDILEGITRREVMDLIGEELAEPVVERSVDRSELYVCDEALLCGTAAGIVPLVEVDRRPIGDGRPGERTRRLVGTFAAIARRETDAHPEWTAPVWA